MKECEWQLETILKILINIDWKGSLCHRDYLGLKLQRVVWIRSLLGQYCSTKVCKY